MTPPSDKVTSPRHITFPSGFVWGRATSAYQLESAWNIDGSHLYHWDLPQALHDTGGWAHSNPIEVFSAYTQHIAHEFRLKVQHWLIPNPPHVIVHQCFLISDAHSPQWTSVLPMTSLLDPAPRLPSMSYPR